MTATDLASLQRKLRQMLPDEGIIAVLAALKKALPEGTDLYNAVFQLETRLNATNKDRLRGVLSQDQLELAYNRISADLLDLIDGLELEHFDVATADDGGAANKTGSILYRIPHTMEVEEEHRCIVRLAFDDEVIIRNIEITRDTVLKDVRVSEVMEVELIDPNPTPSFAIRKLNSAEQFLEKNDYTEWIFFVKPLLTGELPLVLRIAVLEIIDEHERKKEIVLEEVIHVVADAPEPGAAGAAAGFKNAGYTIATGSTVEPTSSKEPGTSESSAPPRPSPTAPSPVFNAPPQAAEGKRRYALALLALIVAVAGIWAAGSMLGWWGNSAAPESLTRIDREDWQSALNSGTKAAFGGYLEKHPEGLFKSVARYKLDSIQRAEQPSSGLVPQQDSLLSEGLADAGADELAEGGPPAATKKTAAKPAKPQKTKPVKPSSTAPTLPQPVGPPKPTDLPVPPPPQVPNPPAKRRSGFEMVPVSGGSMNIGCEDGGKDECPHPITVSNFKIGRYEVTQADWKEVMGNNPSHFNYSRCAECPVEKVSWEEVLVFAKKAGEKYGVRFRLPSEAEWEYAARGGATGKGLKYAGSNRSGEVGWYHDNSEETHRVGQKKPNELGIYDMSGNVWEWCLDTYKPYPGCKSRTTDDRIIRGGSFRNYGSKGRTCNRNFMWPTKKDFSVGFRLVQEN